jgi:hypothetical protein
MRGRNGGGIQGGVGGGGHALGGNELVVDREVEGQGHLNVEYKLQVLKNKNIGMECVRILQYICVLILLYICLVCPHTTIYMCLHTTIYMCPHTTTYVRLRMLTYADVC